MDKTGFLPKQLDYRFPLLKVLKAVLYNSPNNIVDYLKIKLFPTKGSRSSTAFTTQKNAIKNLVIQSNLFDINPVKNIIEAPPNSKLKRIYESSVDPYDKVIADEAHRIQLKKRRAEAAKKRMKKQLENIDQNETVHNLKSNKTKELSAAERENIELKKQLEELKNKFQEPTKPRETPIQANAVITKKNIKNTFVTTPVVVVPNDGSATVNEQVKEVITNVASSEKEEVKI